MRLGYYKLNRPKQKADDWVWIYGGPHWLDKKPVGLRYNLVS